MQKNKPLLPLAGPLLGLTVLLLASGTPAYGTGPGFGLPHDTLAPVVTAFAPEPGLVTADPLTGFRFSASDLTRPGPHSGLDPASLRVTVNGEDRTAQAVLYPQAHCTRSWWENRLWSLYGQDGPKEQGCRLFKPFDWFGWWKPKWVLEAIIDYDPTDAAPLPQGEVDVIVTIADRAGNVGRSEKKIVVDSLGPVITAVSPPDGGTLTDDHAALVVSVTDAGLGVASNSLQITINGEDYTPQATLSGNQLTVTPATAWAEGPLAVTLTASDTLANAAEASFTYTVAAAPLSATPRAIPSRGVAPLTVRLIPEFKTDAAVEKFEWDFDGNGVYDRSEPIGQTQTYTYAQPGTYTVALRLTDNHGKQTIGTVVVEVQNAPPTVVTAKATPSSGAIPLTVQFAITANDNDGIAKYEWDFDGDGVYDLDTTAATGTHTYEQAGTYQAKIRVTDSRGAVIVWSSAALVVHAGAAGTPSAALDANPAAGSAPLTVSFTAAASDPDSTIAEYAWDFDGDGSVDTSGTSASQNHTYTETGTFYPRVRVTSADGGTAEAVAQVSVRANVSLSRSTDTIDTGLGQTVNITTVLGGTTDVSLVMESRDGEVARTLVPWTRRTGGTYVDVWNGLDDEGTPVSEADYYAVLLYKVDGQEYRLDHRTNSGGVQFNPSRTRLPSRFSPLAGEPLSVTVTLNQAAEVTAFIGRYSVNTRLVTLLERRPLGRGSHVLVWNGEDGDGKLFHPPAGDSFLYGLFGFTLSNNAVYVRSGTHVTGVSAEPSIANPLQEESRVSFTLNQAADVELTVSDASSGRAVARRTFTGLSSGANTVNWDGKADDGTYVAPGRYRIGITAIDGNGFRSITVYTLQRVYH